MLSKIIAYFRKEEPFSVHQDMERLLSNYLDLEKITYTKSYENENKVVFNLTWSLEFGRVYVFIQLFHADKCVRIVAIPDTPVPDSLEAEFAEAMNAFNLKQLLGYANYLSDKKVRYCFQTSFLYNEGVSFSPQMIQNYLDRTKEGIEEVYQELIKKPNQKEQTEQRN